MSVQANINIVRRCIEEGLNQGDLLIVGQLVSPDFSEYGAFGETKSGIESLRENIVKFRAAVPSYHAIVEAAHTDKDRVIVSIKAA